MKNQKYHCPEYLFEEQLRNDQRITELINKLSNQTWNNQNDKTSIIKALKNLNYKSVVTGLHDSKLDFNETANFIYKCFKESKEETLTSVLNSKGLPIGFKIIVLEEYFKFYSSVIPKTSEPDPYYPLFCFEEHSYLKGSSICPLLPELLNSYECYQIFRELTETKQLLLEKIVDSKNIWSPQKNKPDIKTIKLILYDPFFQNTFKFLVRDVLTKNLYSISEQHDSRIFKIKMVGIHEILENKFSFNSAYRENRPYFRFRQNLFFTYFFILSDYAAQTKTNISLKYDLGTLSLTMKLNEMFYPLDSQVELELPFQLNHQKLKTLIKDFHKNAPTP